MIEQWTPDAANCTRHRDESSINIRCTSSFKGGLNVVYLQYKIWLSSNQKYDDLDSTIIGQT